MINIICELNESFLWGIPMVALIIGTGIFLTIITKGVIFLRFGTVMRYTAKTLFRKRQRIDDKKEGVTPFQAVCTALAATVGTGNIVGVALGIATGGPGAIFWLWVSALAGMVIKYCEVTLAVAYRRRNARGEPMGGPMYYISGGLGFKRLAAVFAAFGVIASFGTGASVQANSLAGGLSGTFGIPAWVAGGVAALLAGLVLIGGVKRIAGVAEVLVPFMALFYMTGAAAVLCVNIRELPTAFVSIFDSAFRGSAATGGFLGASVMYACRVGMARGVFTHEAGMGSAPIAHASASTDHPARQGLWGAFEVFFDSIVMCTVTGLVILTSGLWCNEPMLSGAEMSSAAFARAIPGGAYLVSVGLALFAFATIIAWYYYGEKCAEYLFCGNRTVMHIYQAVYIIMIFTGSISELNAVWELADLFNGLMVLPNLIAIAALSPSIRRLSADFFRSPDVIRQNATDFSVLISHSRVRGKRKDRKSQRYP